MADFMKVDSPAQFEHIWNLNKAMRVCGEMQNRILSTKPDPEELKNLAAATILRCCEMCAGLAMEFNLPAPEHTSEEVEELIDLASKVGWA